MKTVVAMSVLALVVLLGCRREVESERTKTDADKSHQPEVGNSNPQNGVHAGMAATSDFLERWDSLALSGDSAKLADEHTKLLSEAVAGLGEGAALGEFIEGLHDRREVAIADRLLSEHKKAMFSGKNGAETREGLIVAKDGEFRKRLCFEAGYFFTGPGLKEYLERLSPPGAQEKFLTGYTIRLAESDSVRAINEYKALRSGKITFYGLLDVMDYLAPDGDFANADAIFPDDYDEANNMGAALRQRLLKRWATFHPEAAAKYVLETPKRVKPESIRVVIAKWAETNPEDALAWLENSPAGALHDVGLSEMTQIALKAGKHSDAWQRAAKIGDIDRRVKLATEVFELWAKTDREAAEKAWVELFPPGQ